MITIGERCMYQEHMLYTVAFRVIVSVLEADIPYVGSVPGASDFSLKRLPCTVIVSFASDAATMSPSTGTQVLKIVSTICALKLLLVQSSLTCSRQYLVALFIQTYLQHL